MATTYLITGNPNKLREFQTLLSSVLELEMRSLDLDEIQSLDLHQIVEHKLKQAYQSIQEPVIVEDNSAELENLNGLPGPFIKFFEQRLGDDALYTLSSEGTRAKIISTIGYFDGREVIIVDGIVEGSIVAPRGAKGWGFDCCFVPDGHDQTYAELGPEIKSTISHRSVAARQLTAVLSSG